MIRELEMTEGPLDYLNNNPLYRKQYKEIKNVEDVLKHGKIVQSGADRAKMQDEMLK